MPGKVKLEELDPDTRSKLKLSTIEVPLKVID